MRRTVLALTLFTAAALTAEEPKKDEKADAKAAIKNLGKLMKAVHQGEKSPHVRTEAELKKDAPDWEQLAKDAKAFAEMGAAFKGVNLRYSSPEKYLTSSAALTKAAAAEDK